MGNEEFNVSIELDLFLKEKAKITYEWDKLENLK
jgi:hypothetical protein